MPTKFCPGCGHGIVLSSFVRALDVLVEERGWDRQKILTISGIGCSGWISSPHVQADSLHTTHGRTLAFATGAKIANPDLKIFVVVGDGDGLAIGLNHLLQAARRNLDVTVILANNNIYGMTSGQVAPTTPLDAISTTTPTGNPEPPFTSINLVKAAGATYLARWTTHHAKQMVRSFVKGAENPGFSFIEVLSQCPTYYGRKNDLVTAISMMESYKAETAKRPKTPDILKVGEFEAESDRPEFIHLLNSSKSL